LLERKGTLPVSPSNGKITSPAMAAAHSRPVYRAKPPKSATLPMRSLFVNDANGIAA
jgi:hypothetical protein